MADYTTQLRTVAPARYHDVAPTLVRFIGPVCTSSESGGCVWFTRCGRDINNHKCRECGGTFCDVHHTTEMCTECTGQNYCLVCLGKYTCYVVGCEHPPVEFVHGYHAHYGGCVMSRDTNAPNHTYVYNTGNKFACAMHPFKRVYDESKNLVAHGYNCSDDGTMFQPPAPVAAQPCDSCVLQ